MQNDPTEPQASVITLVSGSVTLTVDEYNALVAQSYSSKNWPVEPIANNSFNGNDTSILQQPMPVPGFVPKKPGMFDVSPTIRDAVLFVAGLIVLGGFIFKVATSLILIGIIIILIAAYYDKKHEIKGVVPSPEPILLNGVTYTATRYPNKKVRSTTALGLIGKIVGGLVLGIIILFMFFIIFIISMISKSGGQGS